MSEDLEKRVALLTRPGYKCQGCVCIGQIVDTLDPEQRKVLLDEYKRKTLSTNESVIPENHLHNFAFRVPIAQRDKGWFGPLLKIARSKQGTPPHTLLHGILDQLQQETDTKKDRVKSDVHK